MTMRLTIFKIVGELIMNVLLIVVADAVVYYVTPKESLNSECPDQPCQTMEHYFNHSDHYFGSKKINVTMKVLQGNHTLEK